VLELRIDDGFIVTMTRKLIRINSENPPGREGEIASFVAERLSEIGLKAWVDRFGDGRANAIGIFKWGDGGKLLLLTHLDTVPAGEGWSISPFGGVVRDGKIYGRGAADAKGAIASMLGALKAVMDSGIQLKGEVIFAAVADEEVNSEGVKRLIAKKISVDYAVVGEPTDLQVCIAHKGRLVILASFHGKPAHASAPHFGINTIYAASEFALQIEKLSRRLIKEHSLLGTPTIAPTIISGGSKDNVIPDKVEVIIDRRTLPGEKLETVVSDLRKEAEKVAETRKTRAEIKIKRWIPPAETESDSRIVSAALEAVSEALGMKTEPRGFNATCDMSFLVNEVKIPSIILGPGSLTQAHAVDEWVSIKELVLAAKIYSAIMLNILKARG